MLTSHNIHHEKKKEREETFTRMPRQNILSVSSTVATALRMLLEGLYCVLSNTTKINENITEQIGFSKIELVH